MATKTTGLELKEFYGAEDYWTQTVNGARIEFWHEELVLKVNGIVQENEIEIASLKDHDVVTIVAGIVLNDHPSISDYSFESFFKGWRKQTNTAFLSVEVPKDKLEAVKASIRDAGGKVKGVPGTR